MRDAFQLDGEEFDVWLSRLPDDRFCLHGAAGEAVVSLAPGGAPAAFTLEIDGRRIPVRIVQRGDEIHVHLDGSTYTLQHLHPLTRVAGSAHDVAADVVRAPMPGSAVSLGVEPGQAVQRGQTLLVMESMKMETTLVAQRDGIVEAVHAVVGQAFEKDAVLVRFRAGEPA